MKQMMQMVSTGTATAVILALLLCQGCAEEPPVRLVPEVDLLDLAPPCRGPDGYQPPAVERQAWSFFEGLPDGWTAGPEGVRVVATENGVRLECEGAEPWLELHQEIDPLLYDRLVLTLKPLAGGSVGLQYAFYQPGNYRPYGVILKMLQQAGETQRCSFNIPTPDSSESVVHSTRLGLGGSGTVLVRQAALVPRPKGFIRGRILPKEQISLSQEFKRCWRFSGGDQRNVTFTVPDNKDAVLRFAAGTLIGARAARCTVELVGDSPKELFSVTMPRPGTGWHDERVDLGRWAGRRITLNFRLESEEAESIHLIGAPTVFAAEEESRPNVILILVDTLRADHLSGYGHHRNTTPHLDRLSRNSMLFTAAAAPASWTIPSVAATLTGHYPGSNNIGHGRAAGVPAGTPTLASILGENGYSTAGFAANALLDNARGFHHGFRHYFFAPHTDNQFTAEELNHRALDWIDDHGDERFFCFLHYMDPHNPYDPPPFLPDPLDPDAPTAWEGGHVRALIAGDVTVDRPEDLERINRFYDEEVRYVDRQIGLLLARLRQLGLLEDTVVLISADHGEELHDRGNWGHGFTLYQELIRVPLILRLPAGMNHVPGLVSTPVSLVDVLPTIAGLVGISPPGDGRPGHSLLEPVEERFLRSGIWGKRAPDLYSVSRGPRKYIYLNGLPGRGRAARNRQRLATVLEAPGAEMFFDLGTDPGERRNLDGETVEDEAALREEMAHWLAEMGAAPSLEEKEQATIDRELEEKLRAMGYMK